MRDITKIQKLVGEISAEDLKYVECSVAQNVGIFIPSVGYCNFAIKPQHTHPSYMFTLLISKENCFIKPELDVPVNYYLTAVLSPEIPHQEETDGFFTRYYAVIISKDFFDKEYYSYTKTQPPEYMWKQFLVSSEIMFYLKHFIYEYEDNNINSEKILEVLSLLIAHQLILGLLKIENKFEPISSIYEIEKAEQYMHQNFGNKLTIQQLAELANMSVSHFIRVFKKETGIAPMEYLIKVRIEKTKKFLKNTDKTIVEIALDCGYSSASYFSSNFLKQTGQSPTQYRKMHRGQ